MDWTADGYRLQVPHRLSEERARLQLRDELTSALRGWTVTVTAGGSNFPGTVTALAPNLLDNDARGLRVAWDRAAASAQQEAAARAAEDAERIGAFLDKLREPQA